MDEIEINIGGIFEQRRLESMRQIGKTEAVAQDNRDLEELQWRYENLQLTNNDRSIIDDLIFQSHNYVKVAKTKIGINDNDFLS